MNVDIVIGANYGDEGKGQTTDWLCEKSNRSIVVMTNGGCQRGHTVSRNGIDHVFHHFGSGSIQNTPTYFPNTYLVNPMKYVEEHLELKHLGLSPICFRSPLCLMQFPVDIFVNRAVELSRKDDDRHGSVGWGIWETTLRNTEWPVTIEEFGNLNRHNKIDLCHEIFERSFEKRLIDIDKYSRAGYYIMTMRKCFDGKDFIEHFIDDFEYMRKTSKILHMDDIFYSGEYETIIFENAQGLLLDSNYTGDNVYSTPSRTGFNGVRECIEKTCSDGFELKEYVDAVTVNYVSRTYLTRHGNGPFPEYDPDMKFTDQTNKPNRWQGSIRFGRFSPNSIISMKSRIEKDFSENILSGIKTEKRVIFTHANEIPVPDGFSNYDLIVSDGKTSDAFRSF